VGQERLGPSYFFISLVLGPLNKQPPLMLPTILKVYGMELGSIFLFLQEKIKDSIITHRDRDGAGTQAGMTQTQASPSPPGE
jgi:hypothetical protein